MLQFFALEKFKEIQLYSPLQLRYAISNYGRLISFTDNFQDGRFLKGSVIEEYPIFRYKVRIDGKVKTKHLFYHRLVAEYFIPKTSEDQIFVLHLNRNRANNFVGNLKWATKAEMLEHQRTSPAVIEAKRNIALHRTKTNGYKLTASRVMFIKRILLDTNRKTRMKMLAKQFGISEMQLYRIKSGENWGHIKV